MRSTSYTHFGTAACCWDFWGLRRKDMPFGWLNANVVPSVCAKRYFAQNYANLMCVLFGKSTACCACVSVCGWWVLCGWVVGRWWCLHRIPKRPRQTSCCASSSDSRQSAWQTEPLGKHSTHMAKNQRKLLERNQTFVFNHSRAQRRHHFKQNFRCRSLNQWPPAK